MSMGNDNDEEKDTNLTLRHEKQAQTQMSDMSSHML
jgi:hypothetical protein